MKVKWLLIFISCLKIITFIDDFLLDGKANASHPTNLKEPIYEGFPLICHIEATNAINNPKEKARTLAKLAQEYIKEGQKNKALDILEQAVQLANIKTNDTSIYYRHPPLPWKAIVESYFAAGENNKAIQFAKNIETNFSEDPVKQLQFEQYMQQKQYDNALGIASLINNEKEKYSQYVYIAWGYAGVRQFEKAINVAEKIKDESEKSRAYGGIALEYAKAGFFEQAIKIANTEKEYVDRVISLGYIAVNYVKFGQKGKALEMITSTLQYIETLKNSPDNNFPPNKIYFRDASPYIESLSRLASATANAGFYDQAIEIAQKITKPDKKAETLRSIALIASGDKLYEKSLEIANSIIDSETKSSALHEVANRYSDAGFSDQALKIANTINHEGWKNLALSTVVWSYIESKNYDQALRVTETIQGSEGAMRELALYQVAEGYTAAQQYDKALSLVEVAENNRQKDAVSAGMSNGYAKSGQVDEAIKLFNTVKD